MWHEKNIGRNMPKNRQQCLNVLKKQRGNDRMTSLTQFMESTYPRIMGIPFDKYVFAESIIRLGGVDMEDFSAQDIVDMCDEKFHGNLRDVLWAFNETLGGYYYTEDKENMCSEIFTLIILCQVSEWGDGFAPDLDVVLRSYWNLYCKLDKSTCIQLFDLCFLSRQNQFHVSKEMKLEIRLKDFMESVYLALGSEIPLNAHHLATCLIHNGGSEMSELPLETVVDLFYERYTGDMSKIQKVFSNTLELYQSSANEDDLCCGILTLIVLSRIYMNSWNDFCIHFARIMDMFFFFFPKLESDNVSEMFYLCFMTRECAGDEKSVRM